MHKECVGKAGCSFYDTTAAEACNGAKLGWIRDYSATQYIACPDGTPLTKMTESTTVGCDKENLINTYQIVNYGGNLVRMIITTCG